MRKLTLLLPLLLYLLIAPDAQSQRRRGSRYSRQIIRAYPTLGATASQIRGDELRGFRKWGFTGGVGAEVGLTSNGRWAFTVEADFSQRGAYNNSGDPYSIFGLTLNYVDIPLTVHFTDPYGGITIGAGLVYSRLVQQPHGEMRYSPAYFVPDTSNMTFLRNDLAFALDMRFPIWRSLYFCLRWQHSLIPVKKDWQFTEYRNATETGKVTWSNDLYNSSISVRLLYKFGDDNRSHKKKATKHSNTKRHR
ncbi:MAG: hypothetical protein IJM88_01640 [Bacteroidales bacterium]|nr:hypothetical protein [Bacteroidales bacterium]